MNPPLAKGENFAGSRTSTADGVNFFSNISGSSRSCRFDLPRIRLASTVNRGFTFGLANYAPSKINSAAVNAQHPCRFCIIQKAFRVI